jgi:hypothetical protein
MPFDIVQNVSLESILTQIEFKQYYSSFEYHFGNGFLQANRVLDFNECFIFYGNYIGGRSVDEFNFILPLKVESLEQGIALIAFHLKSADLSVKPEWLNTGLGLFNHLPWIREQKKYQENPKARVEHADFFLNVRKLRALAEIAREEDLFVMSFDGEILKGVYHNKVVIAAPATGKPWAQQAMLKTRAFSFLPKRIPKRDVDVFIWKEMLHIDRQAFSLYQ